MTQRFRPKANPEIEAYQLTNELVLESLLASKPPPGLQLAAASWHSERREVYHARYTIKQPSGFVSEASLHDWIIIEPSGHCRACHPATFAATYEASEIPPAHREAP